MKRVILCALMIWSLAAMAADGPRVYVEESSSWEVNAHSGGSEDGFAGEMSGGARPQTAEIIKTFGEKCPSIVVNNKKDRADYVVLLHHEGGKDLVRRDNKVAVFNREGDAILSRSTRTLGNAVGDACTAILRDWNLTPTPAVEASVKQSLASSATKANLEVTSSPVGADIEVDDAFVGNTPSALHLAPGEYKVVVKKNGYTKWERKVKVTGGNVTLLAELEKQQ